MEFFAENLFGEVVEVCVSSNEDSSEDIEAEVLVDDETQFSLFSGDEDSGLEVDLL